MDHVDAGPLAQELDDRLHVGVRDPAHQVVRPRHLRESPLREGPDVPVRRQRAGSHRGQDDPDPLATQLRHQGRDHGLDAAVAAWRHRQPGPGVHQNRQAHPGISIARVRYSATSTIGGLSMIPMSVVVGTNELPFAGELGQLVGRIDRHHPQPVALDARQQGEVHLGRHLAQGGVGAVPVPPAAQVDLDHRGQAGELVHVDEHGDLDAVPGHERHPFEQRPAPGVLTGERLDEAGQLRPVQVEQGACHQLGHPAAAGREDV